MLEKYSGSPSSKHVVGLYSSWKISFPCNLIQLWVLYTIILIVPDIHVGYLGRGCLKFYITHFCLTCLITYELRWYVLSHGVNFKSYERFSMTLFTER